MKNKIYLYLDDDIFHPEGIRNPEKYYPLIGAEKLLDIVNHENTLFVPVATVEDAIEYINENGCPNFISFDNDLQKELEGYDLAKWLVEKSLDDKNFMPLDFNFFVHSQNINAKANINSYLKNYLEHRDSSMNSDLKKEKSKKIKSKLRCI